MKKQMDRSQYSLILILAVFLIHFQVSWSRICPVGELQYQFDNSDGIICCKPLDHRCQKGKYVSRCSTNHTSETCEDCPEGKTLAYESSSFNRKACYPIPECKAKTNKPEVAAVNATHCACMWSTGQIHEPPENSHFSDDYNCQPRINHCGAGEEPLIEVDGCRPCSYGFFKEKPSHLSDIFNMCKAWTNCSQLGQEEAVHGTNTSNAVCVDPNTSTPSTGTYTDVSKPGTTDTSTVTQMTNSTTPVPPRPIIHSNILKIVIPIVITIIVLGVLISAVWYCKKRNVRPQTGDVETELKELMPNGDALPSFSTDANSTNSNGGDTMDTSLKLVSSNRSQPVPDHVEYNKAEIGNGNGILSQGSMHPQVVSERDDHINDNNQQTLRKCVDTSPTSNNTNLKTVVPVTSNPQTLQKQVDSPPIKHPSPAAGDETSVKTVNPVIGNSTHGGISRDVKPPYYPQHSNGSGTLPISPITPQTTTKPFLFVAPTCAPYTQNPGRVGEENSDNSSSVLNPDMSDITNPRRVNMVNGDHGAGVVMSNGVSSPVQSFHPPALREGGSLSEDSGRWNGGNQG